MNINPKNPNEIYVNDEQPVMIGDLVSISGTIVEILEYMNTPEMQKLEEEEYNAFEKHMEAKFENFAMNYFKLFQMILTKENRANNVMEIFNLINELKEVKAGNKSYETLMEEFKERKAQEYIYSKYKGGKEEFEEKVRMEAMKKQKKQFKK